MFCNHSTKMLIAPSHIRKSQNTQKCTNKPSWSESGDVGVLLDSSCCSWWLTVVAVQDSADLVATIILDYMLLMPACASPSPGHCNGVLSRVWGGRKSFLINTPKSPGVTKFS